MSLRQVVQVVVKRGIEDVYDVRVDYAADAVDQQDVEADEE
jgi:hypothetical protein